MTYTRAITLASGICAAIFTLVSCTLGATMPQQFTVMNTQCKDDMAVIVEDHIAELNGSESWVAQCEGMTFDCVYQEDAGANCYQRK